MELSGCLESLFLREHQTVDARIRACAAAGLEAVELWQWRDKDLGWISRKMGNIERRLDLSRGGPKTQKMQREVIARLDEMIKQLENQKKNSGQSGASPNGGACPGGSAGGSEPGNTNDPARHQDAKMFDRLTYDRFLVDRIGVMDSTAITLCRDNKMPIRVFKLTTRGNIKRVCQGENIGTIVSD